MNKAIQKAIEGGWTPNMFSGADWTVGMVRAKQDDSITLLDPLFWQALGKAMGWEKFYMPYRSNQTEWETNWHRFIDHLIAGKDTESFFSELLK